MTAEDYPESRLSFKRISTRGRHHNYDDKCLIWDLIQFFVLKKINFGLYYNIILFILFHNFYILSTWFNFHIKHNFLTSQNWMTGYMEPSCDPCRLNLRPQVNWDPGVINFLCLFWKECRAYNEYLLFFGLILGAFWAHFIRFKSFFIYYREYTRFLSTLRGQNWFMAKILVLIYPMLNKQKTFELKNKTRSSLTIQMSNSKPPVRPILLLLWYFYPKIVHYLNRLAWTGWYI